MDDILTMAQIEAQFASEWSLSKPHRPTTPWKCKAAKSGWHSKDRESGRGLSPSCGITP